MIIRNKFLGVLVVAAVLVTAGGLSLDLRTDPASRPDLDLAPEACTDILVGREASIDGSVMSTHAADCGVCDFTWRHVPAADHKPGAMRKLYRIDQLRTWPPSEGLKWDMVLKDFTGVEIPQVPHTYGYHHSIFGYMNDQQLAVAESTISNVRKLSNPTSAPALNISMLTLLAMERCRTAREAIKLMGSLAEEYGYGESMGGEMLAVSDPKEIWIFEIMPVGPLWTPKSGKPGAVWAAQRVPDDHVSVCTNEARIGEMDLANSDFFMASAHVVTFAVEAGLYDPKSGKAFSWKRAYSPSEGSALSSAGRISRMWRFFDLVAPSQKFKPETANMDFPFSVKPDAKLSVRDVMALTRDKSEGTVFDPVRGLRGGPFKNPNYYRGTRLISVPNVEYTTLTQCRSWLPDPIGGIVWVALGAQDTSCYVPFYAGATDIPKSFGIGDHYVLNRDSARWAFDYVDFHVQVAYNAAIEDVKAARKTWEDGALERIREVDARAAELYKKNPKEAVRHVTGFGLNNATNVVNAWWKLGDDLWVKYNHLGLYDTSKRRSGRIPTANPEWWNKAVKAFDVLTEPDKK
ncbi:MAG: C69 family dipeptidase [Candidatus Aminicenantes bacterium]|nr:C69 family dipeptidase [Candidatus Aminicenantes bacterium]